MIYVSDNDKSGLSVSAMSCQIISNNLRQAALHEIKSMG